MIVRIVSYTEKGYKDCSACTIPHRRKNYGYIIGKYKELAEMMERMRSKEE